MNLYICTSLSQKYLCVCLYLADAEFLKPFRYLSFFWQKSSCLYVSNSATKTALAHLHLPHRLSRHFDALYGANVLRSLDNLDQNLAFSVKDYV